MFGQQQKQHNTQGNHQKEFYLNSCRVTSLSQQTIGNLYVTGLLTSSQLYTYNTPKMSWKPPHSIANNPGNDRWRKFPTKFNLLEINSDGKFQRYKICASTHLDIEYRSLIFSFIDNVKPSPDKPKTKFKSIDLLDQ